MKNDIIKKALFKCVEVILTALLTLVGLQSSGCVAVGENANIEVTPLMKGSN